MTDNFELNGYQVPVFIIHNGCLIPAGEFVNKMSDARDLVFKSLARAESFRHRFTRYPSIETIWEHFWIPVVIDQQMVVGFRNTFGSITIQVWEVQCYDNFGDMMRKDSQPITLSYEEIQRTKPVKTRYQNNLFAGAWSLTGPNLWHMSMYGRISDVGRIPLTTTIL